MSFPTRERGLKSYLAKGAVIPPRVVPHAGTWIEINEYIKMANEGDCVVPHAGTWIEICQ